MGASKYQLTARALGYITSSKMRGILAAKKSSKKLKASLSLHSEDSSSSREDRKKDDRATEDSQDLSEKQAKCVDHLKKIQNIPAELLDGIENLFSKYQEKMESEKKGRIKAEAELFFKLDKMTKYLQETTGLQEAVNDLKTKLEHQEKENLELKFELDESHQREQDLYDEKVKLIQKIEQLDRDLDKRQLDEKIKEGDVKGKSKEHFIKEIARLKRDLETLENRFFQSQSDCKSLEGKLQEKEKEYNELEETVKSHKYEVMKHDQKRRVVEADLEKTQETVNSLKSTISKHYETFKNAVHELTRKDDESYELKKSLRALDDQQLVMSKYVIELRDRLEYLSKVYFDIEDQNAKLKSLCSNQTGTLDVIKKKSVDIENFQDKWIRRLDYINKKRKSAMSEAKKLNMKLKGKIKDIRHVDLVNIKLNKRIKELQKEKDICKERIKKLTDIIQRQKEKSLSLLNQRNEMQDEINYLKTKTNEQEIELAKMNKYSAILQKDMQTLEDGKEKTSMELRAALKELINSEKYIMKQENKVKILDTDFNKMYVENRTLQTCLIERNVLTTDYEKKVSDLYKEIAKYKQEFDTNDKLITSLHHKLDRSVLESLKLKNKFRTGKMENKKFKDDLRTNEREKDLLNLLIKKGEEKKKQLSREIENLQRNLANLKATVNQKKSEVRYFYEKTELMSFIMKNEENEIKRKLDDIKLLKSEIYKLRTENDALKNIVEKNDHLRKTIINVERELSNAKQKYRALEEQMENPINVHRWRILKGNDPDKNELIEKNQILLKKLLSLENKNFQLKEDMKKIETDFENFKKIPDSKTGIGSCLQKLHEAKLTIRSKNTQIQLLTTEIRCYQKENKEMKREMEEIKLKTNESMKKYFEMKKMFDEGKPLKSFFKLYGSDRLVTSVSTRKESF